MFAILYGQYRSTVCVRIIIGAACADRIGRSVVDDDSAVSTKTKWGTAILLPDGKSARTPLVPATAVVLSVGTGMTVPAAVKRGRSVDRSRRQDG